MQCRATNPLARRIERWSPKTCMCRPARKTRGTEVMEMKGGEGENNQQENKEAVRKLKCTVPGCRAKAIQIQDLVKSRMPEIVEPKQLIQSRVLVKRARSTVKRGAARPNGKSKPPQPPSHISEIYIFTPRFGSYLTSFGIGTSPLTEIQHFAQSSPALFGLLPFFFPLPPSLLSQFSSSPVLRILASVPTLTLPEVPSLPMKLSSPLFHLYRQSPAVLRYLRATYSLRASSLQGLSVHYRPSASTVAGFTLHSWEPLSFLNRFDSFFLGPPTMKLIW